MKINQTALQVIDFNFYGDNLIALRDNATGEVFTSINSVLKGIGFADKDQIRRRRDKWINDSVIAKGITIFNILSFIRYLIFKYIIFFFVIFNISF